MMTVIKRARKRRFGIGVSLLALVVAWVAVASEGDMSGKMTETLACQTPARGEIRVVPGQSRHAIAGKVYDAEGKTLAGVTVQIDCPEKFTTCPSPGKRPVLVAVTDSAGWFHLDPAVEGLFTLVASDTQHCPVWVQNISAGIQEMTIRLGRVPSITGQVMIYHHGRQYPLAGIEVRAQLSSFDNPVPLALASDRITLTDANGRFRFRGLGAQLRDGQQGDCPALAPTLTWRIECGQVGDQVTVRPTDREVDVKLVLIRDDQAYAGIHRLISSTRTIGRGLLATPGL